MKNQRSGGNQKIECLSAGVSPLICETTPVGERVAQLHSHWKVKHSKRHAPLTTGKFFHSLFLVADFFIKPVNPPKKTPITNPNGTKHIPHAMDEIHPLPKDPRNQTES